MNVMENREREVRWLTNYRKKNNFAMLEKFNGRYTQDNTKYAQLRRLESVLTRYSDNI